MPVYQYEGKHYDLPSGLSNDEAIAKIEGFLGKSPKVDTSADETARLAARYKHQQHLRLKLLVDSCKVLQILCMVLHS